MSNTYDTPSAAPVTDEPEGMSMVRSVFERAANAMVEASKLAKEVAEIRTQVEALRREIEEVQRRNRELDEMLTTTRQQRDEARGKLYDTERELATIKFQLASVSEQLTTAINTTNLLRDELSKKTNDYNQAMDSWHQSETAKEKAEQRLADIEEFAGKAFGLVRPTPSPTAQAAPSQSTESVTVASVPVEDHQNEHQAEPYQQAGYGR